MHNVFKKIVGYFLVGTIFASAVALAVSFAVANSLKVTTKHNEQHKFSFPESTNPPYPLSNVSKHDYFYCWVNLKKYLQQKDFFTNLFNINHFYDKSIPLYDQKALGKNLSNLFKLAIERSPYFQKKTSRLQKLIVDYKDNGNDELAVNCLFTYDEYELQKPVWYYDQLSISPETIKE